MSRLGCARILFLCGAATMLAHAQCPEWNRLIARLPAQERTNLRQHGAAYGADALLFREALVPNCALRVELARYFGRVMNGESYERDEDRVFAARHSHEIAAVLRQIWPALNDAKANIGGEEFSGRMWNLPGELALRPEDVALFLRAAIQYEGLTTDATWLFLLRPLPELRETLRLQASKSAPVVRILLALTCLQRIGEPVVKDFQALAKDPRADQDMQHLIALLINKMKQGKALDYGDIEPMIEEP